MSDILIIEDDLSHLELLAEVIKYAGHTPHIATNSKSALKIITQYSVELIITDIALTHESGLDFIASLQKKKKNIPFIVISGSTHITDHQKAEQLHAISFLKKPIDPQELLKILNTIQ